MSELIIVALGGSFFFLLVVLSVLDVISTTVKYVKGASMEAVETDSVWP